MFLSGHLNPANTHLDASRERLIQGFSISELANRLERPMEKNSLHGNALASRFESGTSSIGYLYKTGTCLREPVDPLQRRKRVAQRQVGQNLHG
ncbi:unnamed protein product [Bursaphelenchus xylophilus]|uniref:(pine wood nematode) hypothetical protein n=1 Tax=Bursaphelenchus xylophilus TaxID=6326 RepID=A0A1I7SCX6_BURXY|nr:unnamed protein product [Bursaphelenchus xylophilus]CAG9093291.1 unnamed protein product [Bursaphelenchus xylophilus]